MPETLTRADRGVPSIRPSTGALELLGGSPAVMRVQELVRRAATLNCGVLLTAEPGADVGAVAHELHHRGTNSTAACVVVDCGAMDPVASDRLLFGSPAGHATGDLECVSNDSHLAAARCGTLFLQEVLDLSAAAQARLARVARDGEVRIEGAPVAIDCRFVASAPPTIDAEVHAGRFRPDLFRRLSGVRIDLPALRNRAADLPGLASRLLHDVLAARGLPSRAFTQSTLALIGALTWPGNLAELQRAVERVVSSTDETVIQIEHLLPALQLDRVPAMSTPAGDLREARRRFERDYIAAVLQHHHWRMADAALTLGIQRPNLYRKMRQLGIPLARVTG